MEKKYTPSWLKKKLISAKGIFATKSILSKAKINTVCESSICPNLNECFSKKRATFLILGDVCTRNCGFCSVQKGAVSEVSEDEPGRISAVVRKLALEYVVITSVTRDDLEDGGSGHFVKVIRELKVISGSIRIEVLVPDFKGMMESVKEVVKAGPSVLGHNLETIERLYSSARRGSDYRRSLDLLREVKEIDPKQMTKSSLMVGLGEKEDEVYDTMKDIIRTGCDILTIGQYLRPSEANLPVERFVAPEEFKRYNEEGLKMGFKHVAAGPFVRSSYLAEDVYNSIVPS